MMAQHGAYNVHLAELSYLYVVLMEVRFIRYVLIIRFFSSLLVSSVFCLSVCLSLYMPQLLSKNYQKVNVNFVCHQVDPVLRAP